MKKMLLLLALCIPLIFSMDPKKQAEKDFFEAVKKNEITTVENLIKEGKVDVNVKNNDGNTALMIAVKIKSVPLIKKILDEVPDLQTVQEAMKFAETDEIRNLLQKAKNQYILYEKILEKKSNSDISDIENFITTTPIIS